VKTINVYSTNLIDKFNNDQLQNVTKRVHLVDAVTQIVERSVLHQQQTLLKFVNLFNYHNNKSASQIM